MKKCPFCAELIQDAAVLCRFCGREVPAPLLESDKESINWREFGEIYMKLSPQGQATQWAELTEQQRAYCQQTLGLPPPSKVIARVVPTMQAEESETPRWLLQVLIVILAIVFVAAISYGLIYLFRQNTGLVPEEVQLNRDTFVSSHCRT